MTEAQILGICFASLISIIAFFLIRLINDHDKTKALAAKTAARLATIEEVYDIKHDNLGSHIKTLSDSIEKFSGKIDQLTNHVLESKK